jgi:hypothetical protein
MCFQRSPTEEGDACAERPLQDRKPVILKRMRRSFWGGRPGHFAVDEAVILNRTARSFWSGLCIQRLNSGKETQYGCN